jgi:MraZ protein
LIFRGTFEHALDAKHRLTVPAKFRAALASGAVLAASPEIDEASPRCVSIWRPEDFEVYVDRMLGAHNPGSPVVRQLERFFFNNSAEAELDSANRLMIPPNLLRYGNLGKDVVVAGSGRCLEVWDRARFEAYQEGVLARIPELTARLGNTA